MATITESEKSIMTCIYIDALENTSQGRQCIKIARDRQIEWKKSKESMNDSFTTAKMDMSILHKKIKSVTKKLKIIPIGVNNCCHWNADILSQCNFEAVLGFNITACPCGKNVCFELHSVNKRNGELYDFTLDFAGEKEKYFYPLETKMGADEYVKNNFNTMMRIDKGCRCPIDWSRTGRGVKTIRTNEELNNYMKMINEKPVIKHWKIDEGWVCDSDDE